MIYPYTPHTVLKWTMELRQLFNILHSKHSSIYLFSDYYIIDNKEATPVVYVLYN